MKKFLSLVLALVMTMSLVTVSAGAKDFTDDGDITYDEAVAVMSAVGVIDGYTDGSFQPTTNLTRGATAKIICNLILGPTTAAALGADTAPYSDVPTTNTFAGYIAYCQKEGIISGYADGTFRPSAPLTGYAFMKMLLGALGYDSTKEGYTGANWSVNVAKQAIAIGLDDGNDDFVGQASVNREEAMLYAFNTMKATMVEYGNDTTITVGDITVSQSGKASKVVNNTKTDGNIDDDGYMQFAEEYFSKLVGKDATDDFGRPATKWVNDGDTVGTYADEADNTLVLDRERSLGAILVTNADYFSYGAKEIADEIALYINGDKQTGSTYAALSGTNLVAGDQIEVYENSDDEVETIAVVRYSLAKIDEIDEDISSSYVKQGASVGITLTGLDEDVSIGSVYYDAYENNSAKVLAGYDAKTYEEGTVLAVALNEADAVLASHVADSAEGKITAYDGGSKANVTVGGTNYPLHATIDMVGTQDTAMTGLANLFNYDDSTYAVYTDANGYVIGIDATEGVKMEDVYYVAGVIKDSSRYVTYYAQAVSLVDGTVTEFKLDSTPETNDPAFGDGWESDNGIGSDGFNEGVKGLFTFKKDGSNYVPEKYDSDRDSVYDVTSLATVSDDLKRDDTRMTIDGKKVYLEETTNYLKVESSGANIDVKTATGGTSVKASFDAIAIYAESGTSVATYVILVSNDFSTATSDDVVFISGDSSKVVSYTDADGDVRKGYQNDVYMLDGSGEVVEDAILYSNYDTGYYTYEINDDDVYELEQVSSTSWEDTTMAAEADGTVVESWDGTANAAYDDETGYYKEANLTSVYKNTLSVAKLTSGSSKNFTLDDVDFASNVIIADDRSAADRDADYYKSEITTVSQLKSAVDRSGNTVVADVYYSEGEVVMVYVWSMTNDPNAGVEEPEGDADTSVKTVELSATGTITLTLNDSVSESTDYSATLYMWNAETAEYVKIGSYTVTVASGDNGTKDVSAAMVNGTLYKAVVGTVESDPVACSK